MNVLLVSLLGCPREAPTWTGLDTGADPTPTDKPTTDTPPTHDTAVTPPGSTTAAIDGWTDGPALPECTPKAGDPGQIALSGVVLTPDGAEAGYVVVDQGSGTVVCAGADCKPGSATVVCTEGVISPALIDAHDHGQYNVLAPWQHDKVYHDRYEWQSDGDYYDYRAAYDDIADTYECEIMKWAELRQIVGGATSIVGSYGDACIDTLARDLDADQGAHDISGYSLKYSSGKVFYYDSTDASSRHSNLVSGSVDAYEDHVAEGVGGSVRDEIDLMLDLGMSGPGNVFVHSTDASVEQLARMAATGTGIVWSPRSNLDLYHDTTPADVALSLGVPVAIGPDWTWSGSNRVTAELSCAHDWLQGRRANVTDQKLWEMATLDASVLLGLQGQLGMLVPGAKADVAVFAYTDQPYRAVIESKYEDVRLVMISGYARYGVPELVGGLEQNAGWCESVTACGESRTLCVAEGDSGTDAATYHDLEDTLSVGLAQTTMPSDLKYAGELYPLWACDEVRDSCDPRSPSGGDTDGDGIKDAADDCVQAFDSLQLDYDKDGLGDACDPCPLSTAASCGHDTQDVDDDGIPNDSDDCPYIADPGNPDGDEDGHGDACDACPTVANPGAEACPATIRSLRDPSDPGHPPVGTTVTIHGVVVTAVGSAGSFLQDPADTEFAGLYAYGVTNAAVGDTVDATGQYDEYNGLTELGNADATVKSSGSPIDPIEVDPCDVANGGSLSEKYESMLVAIGATTVTDANPDAPSDFNEFEVGGCLRIDDFLCTTCWTDQPAVDTAYSAITGPLYYSFGDTKIVPRDAADLAP